MKKIIAIIAAIVVAISMTSCNKQLIDVTYSFDRAVISLPNGEIVNGKVQSWKDYEGDQIQVKIGGTTYLVHSEDIALIHD